MQVMILSDIHANLTALEAVLEHAQTHYGDMPIIHLGDIVDYGMRPDACIAKLWEKKDRLVANLAGNHEVTLFGRDMERFSSDRGRQASLVSASMISDRWKSWVDTEFSAEPRVLSVDDKKILCIHGDLRDPLWGSMSYAESLKEEYKAYDFVLSGHSHVRFCREIFYADDSAHSKRGKKKTLFINPGSVGQPRNHNSAAQYAVINFKTEDIHLHAVPYDIANEVALYDGRLDIFYADRLEQGV